MCLHLIELLSGFRSHSKRIKMSSKTDLNSSGSILDDILPIYESPTKKIKKKSTRKYSSEFEAILLKKLILPEKIYSNEKFTKLICQVNLSSSAMPTPRSILRIKRRRSDHIPMERTPKRVKLDVSDNSTEKKKRKWDVESTEEEDDSNDDDYSKSDSKKHKKSAKKSNKKIKEEISKKRATRNLDKNDSSSDEEIVKSPRKLRSPIMFKGVNSSDEDPVADNKFKKMIKRQSIESPEKLRKNSTEEDSKKTKGKSVTPKKDEDKSKKSNGQRKSHKKTKSPEINKKALTKTFGKKFFQCKVTLDCSSKEEEEEEEEEEENKGNLDSSSKEDEEKEERTEDDKVEEITEKAEEVVETPVKEPTNISSDDDSIFGDSKRPKTPVRRNSKSPSPFSKLLAESKKEKEILPTIVVTEDDLSQTEVSEAATTSDQENLNEVGLSCSNDVELKTTDAEFLNCFDNSQEELNLSKSLPFLANEVDKLISDLDK